MGYYKVYSDEFYHHGVLGMKWGVRRYRNKDGSLTEAGKKRQQKKERSDHYWKLLESEAAVINTKRNRDTFTLMAETEKDPAKKQMYQTFGMIADREFNVAKSAYIRIAEEHFNKYGTKKKYVKEIVNTKNLHNARGQVMRILSEDNDPQSRDFVNKLRDD